MILWRRRYTGSIKKLERRKWVSEEKRNNLKLKASVSFGLEVHFLHLLKNYEETIFNETLALAVASHYTPGRKS